MKNYPIILFAYNRPWHTEQVLMALKNNQLAEQSHLIVFVDGPKDSATPEQRRNIEEVRWVVQKEKWCGSVEYHLAEHNIGCRNSIIQGITEVLQKYEAAIVLEDDIVTSPYFLNFMNKSLNYYINNKSVISISGYNFPSARINIPLDYKYDVYISLRQLNWGWATWSDRWNCLNWSKDFIPDFLQDKYKVNAFNRGGDDLSKMLIDEYNGLSDAWDVQFCYFHFMQHGVSIIPCLSYTNNIGFDDSGTHTLNQNSEIFKNDLSICKKNPKFLQELYEDSRIVNAFYNNFSSKKRPVWQKIINRISRMLGGKNVFVIKKKIYA